MNERLGIALFGEAERGEYKRAHYCENIPQLVDYFGNPPSDSNGLYYAVQALLYNRILFFFRVKEEGYSQQDYFTGIHFLQAHQLTSKVSAICIPGVGDSEIIGAITPLCLRNNILLIMSEADLYDYLIECRC